MASSKLLKEAIADAKAVRETAIANAKIALEEAFTPRLQSILSRKLQAEMEGDEEEADMNEDNDVSTGIGTGDNKQPADAANSAQTDLSGIAKQSASAGDELEGHDEVDDLMEGEEEDSAADAAEDEAEYAAEGEEMAPEADEDELDLESIIRELEDELGVEESDELGYEDPTGVENAYEGEEEAPAAEAPAEDEMEAPAMEGEEEETIDLDEILREMGYGDDEEAVSEEEEAGNEEEMAAMQSELKEAYSTIQSLRKTINEVNLLNAKLLYTNKLFRNYNLTNEQKVKVVENLDRTSNVREVKLVYATLSESMKFTGTERKVAQAKKSITEGLASKPTASTAPAKQIISENTNELANRFKQLAGIIK
jgi:hypothetical protein